MVRIAPHHSTKHPLPSDTDYSLTQDWGDDVYVQWGRYPDGDAFFEAFTDDGIMLRSDENSLKLAEEVAFAKYLKVAVCNHQWSRKFPNSYGNGVGVCRKCKQTNTKAFKGLVELGQFRKQLTFHEIEYLNHGALRPYAGRRVRQNSKTIRRLDIKARLMGIKVPPLPEHEQCDDEFTQQIPNRYSVELREAVIEWLETGKVDLEPAYVDILKRRLHGDRVHSARVWGRISQRNKLCNPAQIGRPGAIVIRRDEKLMICTSEGNYTPDSRESYTGLHDKTDGGLIPGDMVVAEFLSGAQEIVIYIPDGRKLYWSRDCSQKSGDRGAHEDLEAVETISILGAHNGLIDDDLLGPFDESSRKP